MAIIAAVVFVVAVLTISVYLGPDDLRYCTAPGDGKCKKADAIVVLSGGDTTARTAEGVKLYQQGFGGMLVFSGAAADKSGPSNAEVMQKQAIASGVPAENTLTEETSETTGENAKNTVALLSEHGFSSIILVTSAYHQRRALLEFTHYGASLTIRSHPVGTDKDWGTFWYLTPWGWNLAGSELVKTIVTANGGADR